MSILDGMGFRQHRRPADESGLVYWPEFLITCNKCGQGNVVLEQSPGGMRLVCKECGQSHEMIMDPS